MISLRDRWRRTAWCQYWDGVDPISRAGFWIVAGLALALAVSVHVIVQAP